MPKVACRPAPRRPRCTLGEIFRRHGQAYRDAHRLGSAQAKAMRAIERCRTAELGGHREWCPRCGFERFHYHSCRNRHCPQCQALARTAWVHDRQAELLSVPYFHHVFTLPHELNPLLSWSERNRRALLTLLFGATAQTLSRFGRGEFDGGQVGFTLVLHTWDQQLRPHFHLHCLMASGALANDGARWIAGGAKYLFPVRALSRVFKAKYLDGLAELLDRKALDLPPSLRAPLGHEKSRRTLLSAWRKKSWVVYSKAPFAGPKKLLDYLGRYTHRVAISNDRLLDCRDGQVRFAYRDRRDRDRRKTTALAAPEFIHRFLIHVLPDRFRRIRHYGFLANRAKARALPRCRTLIGQPSPSRQEPRATKSAEQIRLFLGEDVACCPRCGGLLECFPVAKPPRNTAPTVPPPTAPARVLVWDTS